MRNVLPCVLLMLACTPTIPDSGVDTSDPCLPTPGFMEAYALDVVVRDDEGEPVPEAVLTWQQPEAEVLPCDPWDDGHHLCGPSVVGTVVLNVQAPRHDSFVEAYTVEADLCGAPITRYVDVVLPRFDCPGGAMPSVIAQLRGRVVDAYVAWKHAETDGPMEPCESVSSNDPVYVCGWDEVGVLDVGLFVEGVQTQLRTVDVPMDEMGCHAVTQELTFRLE